MNFIQILMCALLCIGAQRTQASPLTPSRSAPIIIVFDLHEVLMQLDIAMLLRTTLYALVTAPKNTFKIAYDYLRDHEFDLYYQSARNMFNSQRPIPETWTLAAELRAEGFPLFLFSNIEGITFLELKQRYPEQFALFTGFQTMNSPEQKKPALSAFLSFETLVKSYGYLHPKIVFIDDNIHNIAVAQKIGWHAILYKDPHQLTHDLEQTITRLLRAQHASTAIFSPTHVMSGNAQLK